MFDLEKFIENAKTGQSVDVDGFRKYVNSFETVIIWGAGNLGTAVGRELLNLNINISLYWDMQADKKVICNGITVQKADFNKYDKDKTFVIFCIANEALPSLFMDFRNKGFQYLLGKTVFYAFICPINNSNKLDASTCNMWDECSACGCQRLFSVVQHKMATKKELSQDKMLAFDRVHFITNNTCSLGCKYCISMMNSYRKEQKKIMPLERIYKDINSVMTAIDAFGVVNIFGGEPFLHKDISKIAKRVLEYDNFGAIIINTNGVVNISEDQLEGLEDNRIRVAFSNYTGQLSREQQIMFERSYELAKRKGVIAKTQNTLPMWSIPPALTKHKDIDENLMTQCRNVCAVPYLYVFNGKIFPCLQALLSFDLEIEDNGDYIEIDTINTTEELRERILELYNRKFHQSCAYCYSPDGSEFTDKAGEQGVDQRYMPL